MIIINHNTKLFMIVCRETLYLSRVKLYLFLDVMTVIKDK